MMEVESCRICMSDQVHEPAAVKSCGHTFCHTCIYTWAKRRLTPQCPLCFGPANWLVLHDQREEEVVPEVPVVNEEALDLGCLDHSYFLSEVHQLLRRANVVHDSLCMENYGCGRRGTAEGEAALGHLDDLRAMLRNYQTILEAEVQFNPVELLGQLYGLQDMLTSISNKDLSALERLDSSATAPQVSQTAGEVRSTALQWHGDDDEDDDDYEGDEDDCLARHRVAWSRTPGRRPPHRTPRSTGRPRAR